MTETDRRKPPYRKLWFWLLVVALVYLIVGFGLVPLYLASVIPDRLQQHLGWSTEMDEVTFNPFTFNVGVSGVEAVDDSGTLVFSAADMELNAGLPYLVRGTVHIEELVLDEPYLRLDLLDDDQMNLMQDWLRHNPEPAAEGDAIRMLVGDVTVNGGEVLLRDFTRGGEEGPREFRIRSLGLTLANVATWEQEEAGSYTVQATVGEQVIDWRGTLSLFPFWSNGEVALRNVSAETFQYLFREVLPYRLDQGQLSFTTAYQFALDEIGIALATRQGQLTGENLAITSPDGNDLVASAGRLVLNGVAYNMDGPELVISSILGEAVDLTAVMSQDSHLNLVAPFREADSNAGDSDDSNSQDDPRGLRWSIGNVSLSDSTIHWRDNRPETPVEVTLQGTELTLGAMTERLEEPVTYQLNTSLGQGGSLSANGQFTLDPLTFEGGVNLDQAVLAPFNGYLQEISQLVVQDGTVNLSGNIDIDVQDEPLTGTFSGRGSVSHFNARLLDSEESLVSWRELRLDPIEYNFAPSRLELGTVTLSEPELNVINRPGTGHNIGQVLADWPTPVDEDGVREQQADDPGSDESVTGLIFRLRQLEVANAEIRYSDRTVNPAFDTHVHELNTLVSSLSNITPQQGRFSLQGRVNDTAALKAEGTIATLGSDGPSELDVALEGLSLPVLNPYFGRYLGYRVDRGKLSLEADYTFTGTRVDGNNIVTLNRLELGEPVQSDEATTAPVRLGLSLLRDGDGQIQLNIPVDGNLSDPEFHLGQDTMRTFANLVVRTAASPFNLLGSLVDLAGFSGEELGSVGFMAGETTLEMGEYTKMESLAEALKARSGLVLGIRGIAVEAIDRPALEAGLKEGESLPEHALANLAEQRGKSLQRLLRDEYNVPPEQLFLRASEVRPEQEGDTGTVAVQFELEGQ